MASCLFVCASIVSTEDLVHWTKFKTIPKRLCIKVGIYNARAKTMEPCIPPFPELRAIKFEVTDGFMAKSIRHKERGM